MMLHAPLSVIFGRLVRACATCGPNDAPSEAVPSLVSRHFKFKNGGRLNDEEMGSLQIYWIAQSHRQ
jgi:hypothetical protein